MPSSQVEICEGRGLASSLDKQEENPRAQISRPTNLHPIFGTNTTIISSSTKPITLDPSLYDSRLLIQTSGLSPYRQRVLLALLQVPRGQHTTYAALAQFLVSSPRAVGNAMRNNPFAPTVPCHRVLAADGRIGGFKGEWGEGSRETAEKTQILRAEGVRFDGKGKVVGSPWRSFV